MLMTILILHRMHRVVHMSLMHRMHRVVHMSLMHRMPLRPDRYDSCDLGYLVRKVSFLELLHGVIFIGDKGERSLPLFFYRR